MGHPFYDQMFQGLPLCILSDCRSLFTSARQQFCNMTKCLACIKFYFFKSVYFDILGRVYVALDELLCQSLHLKENVCVFFLQDLKKDLVLVLLFP